MQKAKSIDAADLMKIAEAAARDVLGDDMNRFGGELTIGRWPIGTIGLIWHNPDFEKFDSKQMLAVSEKMVAAMQPVVGDVSPIALISKDFGTVGFFPKDPIDIMHF